MESMEPIKTGGRWPWVWRGSFFIMRRQVIGNGARFLPFSHSSVSQSSVSSSPPLHFLIKPKSARATFKSLLHHDSKHCLIPGLGFGLLFLRRWGFAFSFGHRNQEGLSSPHSTVEYSSRSLGLVRTARARASPPIIHTCLTS
jgi:hypothetical protein